MTRKKIEKRLEGMKWQVINYNINRNLIEPYNIFKHGSFREDLIKLASGKTILSFKEFNEQLQKDCHYYFWAKCEYEVIISSWPPSSDGKEAHKMDFFEQLQLNWDVFANYVYNHLFGDEA